MAAVSATPAAVAAVIITATVADADRGQVTNRIVIKSGHSLSGVAVLRSTQ